MILAGDIGGTHARLALFERGKIVVAEGKYPSREYKSLEEIIQKYLQGRKVSKACLGVAGPVRDGICKTTNLPWVIDASQIGQAVGISTVHLLNDLEANAWGLNALRKEDFYVLHEGKRGTGNLALISAGTGLGEAGLVWDGKMHLPFACEGGHTDFGPRDAIEVELWAYLNKKFGHVSYERVVSGPGLYSIFQFLIDTGKEVWSPAVSEEMKKKDPARVVSEWGCQNKDRACTRAVEWFVSLYGAEAGNLALKFLSLGGVFVGGGIAPNMLEKMKTGAFHSSFVNKGRFSDLLTSIPIWVILNDNAALLGAAYYAERR